MGTDIRKRVNKNFERRFNEVQQVKRETNENTRWLSFCRLCSHYNEDLIDINYILSQSKPDSSLEVQEKNKRLKKAIESLKTEYKFP